MNSMIMQSFKTSEQSLFHCTNRDVVEAAENEVHRCRVDVLHDVRGGDHVPRRPADADERRGQAADHEEAAVGERRRAHLVVLAPRERGAALPQLDVHAGPYPKKRTLFTVFRIPKSGDEQTSK